jgi:CRP-like cAMP-binding protein
VALDTEGRLEGEPLDLEQLRGIPVFSGCSEALLKKNLGAVVRRRFAPGEIICREGEFGSTAFYILDGEAEVFLKTPVAHLEGKARMRGLFGGITSFLQSLVRREEQRARAGTIPIDAPVDLSLDRPEATLVAGDLFGEMTCMSFYPRSATVRARGEVTVLEMLRNILDVLKRGSKEFKEQLDRAYKGRALATHLKAMPLFDGLTDEFIDGLRERVSLVTYDPGKVICKQGDPADRLYLIRIGFVKVSQESPGGEVILKYLHRGDYFGEMGLLGAGKRTATCTALDHVELVEIGQEDFSRMIQEFPAIRRGLEEKARAHAAENARRLEQLAAVSVDDFLEQGLMQAQSLLLIDLDRCTRCDECVRACAASHDGVTRLIRDGLRFDRYLVPTSCRSCHDPLCMVGCPVGSIRRMGTMEIVIEDWCIGCGLCARNCPYGNINMHGIGEEGAPGKEGAAAKEEKESKPAQKAITCDLCAGLKEPTCVYACPHEAAFRVDPKVFLVRR